MRLRSSTPGRNPGAVDLDPEIELLLDGAAGRRLVCRFCRAPITADSYRIDVEGRHLHRKINPAGVEFELGCFEKAPGAAVAGEATAEHSWFLGYVWSFSVCRACGSHLGWFFEGRTPTFHGLILDRLEDDEA